MNTINFRKAEKSDMDWLYETFKATMSDYIEKTWGWNELFQQHGFYDNLPPSSFIIATTSAEDVGAYSILEKNDHLWLEMVIVPFLHQGKGLGRTLVEKAQQSAKEKQKPLRLSVLKINPARDFYLHLGFESNGEDTWSSKMEWNPPL